MEELMVRLPCALASLLVLAACGSGSESGPAAVNVGGVNGAALGGGGQNLGGGGTTSSVGGTPTTTGGSIAGGVAGIGGSGMAGSGGDAVGGSAGTSGAGPDGGASYPYSCNLIIGIQTTSEWFRDFDDLVDIERWEMMHKDSAHLEKWAEPDHELWSLEKDPACAQNAEAPERVVFMGVEYDYTTVEEFLPDYVAVIENIKTKYPSVKRVDVMTYTRAPANMECTSADRSAYSYIKPAQDEAITQLVAKYPGFVYATPRWEVESCDDFNYCPHLTGDANEKLAATLASYFDGK
ncbi:MAG TPA: hypothetical protein VHM25_03505 [Polyangiaceae bacterium]|nr:hypothetical protein [Polyangiaceae bacterium]